MPSFGVGPYDVDRYMIEVSLFGFEILVGLARVFDETQSLDS